MYVMGCEGMWKWEGLSVVIGRSPMLYIHIMGCEGMWEWEGLSVVIGSLHTNMLEGDPYSVT